MSNNETRVVYKAIADFTALSRSVRKAKKDLAELRAEEAALNASSVSGAAAATVAKGKHTKEEGKHAAAVNVSTAAVGKHTAALGGEATAATNSTKAVKERAAATKASTAATTSATKSVKQATTAALENAQAAGTGSRAWGENARAVEAGRQATERATTATEKLSRGTRRGAAVTAAHTSETRRSRKELASLGNAFTSTLAKGDKLNKGLTRLGDWRPRLMPPFIALIPIIGAVLGLINPLIAGLGAVGVAGLGFASSLGSLGGAAIGAIPGIVALISVVSALKMAFGGVGTVFKNFGAMQKAKSAPKAQRQPVTITHTEEVTRAQNDYANSIENVQWAEDDLNDSRAGYIKRLEALKKAVEGAAAAEQNAAANAQLAKENYANVLADPGATKGQKMAALASLNSANTAVVDVKQQARDDAAELRKMQKLGIDGDKEVIRAKRALVDAIDAERDSEIALQNARSGANKTLTAAETATDEYQAALDKLSPSAKAVVLALLGMRDAWKGIRKEVQESFFSEVVGEVGSLTKLFPVLNTLLSGAAGALGRVAKRGIELTTSNKWLSDLGIIAENNTPLIENVGDGLLAILDLFKSLAVAAGPFGVAISEGFKKGAENLAAIMSTDSARAGLAQWLDTVLDRMRQWWRIVKNVGMTLFNYGAATSGFGKWLTDGFESITEGWRKASEEARKEGSPFQKYLEDVKPLLHEVGALLGTFFKWFAKTSMDPDNIKMFTDIVKMLREDLGPALGKLLDLLSKSGVGKDLISGITSIVEALATLLDNGGLEGIKAFWQTVSTLFEGLNGFLKAMPEGVVSLLVSSFMTLAALRFFGLQNLIGGLLKLGKSKGLLRVLDKIPGIGAAGSKGAHAGKPVGIFGKRGAKVGSAISKFFGGGTAAAATATGAHAGPGGGILAGLGKSGGTRAIPKVGGVAASMGSTLTSARGISKTGGKLAAQIGRKAITGLGKGGIIGVVTAVAAGLVADDIKKNAPKGKKGAGARVGANALEGAASGAAIGGLVGNVIPIPGVGAAVGAAVGGAVGGAVGVATSSEEDKAAFFADIQTGWDNFWGTSVPQFWTDLGAGISTWFTDLGTGWTTFVTETLPTFIGTLAADIEFFFTDTLPNAWNTFWGTTWPQFWTDLGDGWNTFFTDTLPTAWNTFWGTTWPKFWGDLGAGWNTFFTVTLPKAWDTYWGTTFPKFWTNFGAGLGRFFTDIGTNWDGYWGETFPEFWSNLGAGIGGFFSDLTSGWNDFWGTVFGNTSSAYENRKDELRQGRHNGGVIRRASGGSVPGSGNSDTKPAMLTPGEYVVRKAIVNRVGLDNMTKFNAGVMSYSELLRSSMASASGPKKVKGSGSGVSFLNGGGLVPSIGSNFGGGSSPRGLSTTSTSNSTTNNKGITVENLTVINPTPETAGQSMSRELRKMAYFGAME